MFSFCTLVNYSWFIEICSIFLICFFILMNFTLFKEPKIMRSPQRTDKISSLYILSENFLPKKNLINFVLLWIIILCLLLAIDLGYYYGYCLVNRLSMIHWVNTSWVYWNNYYWLLLGIFIVLYFSNVLWIVADIETLIIFFVFLAFAPLYIVSNNLFLFFILLEGHSLLMFYLLILAFPKKKTFENNFFFLLLLIFWFTFMGAILFLLSIIAALTSTTCLNWTEISIVNFYSELVFVKSSIWLWLPLFLAFCFKLGVFPFILWKPELFKLLPPLVFYAYITFYILNWFFFIFVFLKFFIPLSVLFFSYFVFLLTLVGFLIIPLFFFSISEFKTFLVFSSSLQIFYALLLICLPNPASTGLSLLFILNYFFLNLLLIFVFFCLPINSLWYLSDLQFLKHPLFFNSFLVFFLSSAGIPPFLGFFLKLSMISCLLSCTHYFHVVLIITGSYFAGFFYWQLLRFLILSPYSKKGDSILPCVSFWVSSSLIIFFNSSSFFFFSDFLLLSNLIL